MLPILDFMKQCSVESCLRERIARGFCKNHYRKFMRYGDPLAGRTWGTCASGHDLTDPANVYKGRSTQCLICMSSHRRKNRLWWRFKMTPEQWDSLFESQGKKCAICFEDSAERWMVDHDHSCCDTQKTCGECVRGILCQNCNDRMRAVDEWSEAQLDRAKAYRHNRSILMT